MKNLKITTKIVEYKKEMLKSCVLSDPKLCRLHYDTFLPIMLRIMLTDKYDLIMPEAVLA